MILDSRELPADHRIRAQVCIVGSGPVGCAIALELSRKGLRVVVAEAGDAGYDRATQREHWSAGDRGDRRHPPLELWRRRMLGGASAAWGGRCLPLRESDFDPWAGHWPIDYPTYAAYLPRAAEFLELGAGDFGAASALPGGERTRLEGLGHRDLDVDTLERYSPPTRVAPRYWRDASASENLTVLLNAPCIEIRLDRDKTRARYAVVAPRADRRCRIHADSFVLAAGGIETARLLLASNRDREQGLGNENDLVGRHYMTHFVGNLGLLRTPAGAPPIDLPFVRTVDGIYARRNFQVSDVARRREGLGAFLLRPSVGRIDDPSHGSGVLSGLFLARFLFRGELFSNMHRRSTGHRHASPRRYLNHAANLLLGAPAVLAFAYAWYVDRPRRYRKLPGYDFRRRDDAYPLEFNAEQAPNPSSRIRLAEARDPLGMPLAAVDWRVCDEDRRTVRRGFEIVRDAIASGNRARVACGEDCLEAAVEELWPAGGHHLGTARCSASPREGVVGPDMQLWSVKGLYVSGGAVFPRSGAANPTLSAVALAFRLADELGAPRR